MTFYVAAYTAMLATGNFYLSTSPWLNAFMFPASLNSAINNIGILLVCGMFTRNSTNKVSTKRCNNAGNLAVVPTAE
jgi:hypothetical protein